MQNHINLFFYPRHLILQELFFYLLSFYSGKNKLFEIFDTEKCFEVRDLDVNGKDVMEATGVRGKEVGEVLQTLLFAVFDEKVSNKKEDLIEYLKKS